MSDLECKAQVQVISNWALIIDPYAFISTVSTRARLTEVRNYIGRNATAMGKIKPTFRKFSRVSEMPPDMENIGRTSALPSWPEPAEHGGELASPPVAALSPLRSGTARTGESKSDPGKSSPRLMARRVHRSPETSGQSRFNPLRWGGQHRTRSGGPDVGTTTEIYIQKERDVKICHVETLDGHPFAWRTRQEPIPIAKSQREASQSAGVDRERLRVMFGGVEGPSVSRSEGSPVMRHSSSDRTLRSSATNSPTCCLRMKTASIAPSRTLLHPVRSVSVLS